MKHWSDQKRRPRTTGSQIIFLKMNRKLDSPMNNKCPPFCWGQKWASRLWTTSSRRCQREPKSISHFFSHYSVMQSAELNGNTVFFYYLKWATGFTSITVLLEICKRQKESPKTTEEKSCPPFPYVSPRGGWREAQMCERGAKALTAGISILIYSLHWSGPWSGLICCVGAGAQLQSVPLAAGLEWMLVINHY